jgi:hypothetical protein
MQKTFGYDIKERNIIINSLYAQQNLPDLYTYMENHPKVTALEYIKLTDETQQLLLRPALLLAFEMCKKEWRIVKGIGNEFKMLILEINSGKCQICNARIRFVFYIRNEFTNVELGVGCECIKNYSIDKGNLDDFKNISAKQIEAARRIQALQKLNLAYPALQSFIRDQKYYLRSNTYVLNKERKKLYLEKLDSLSSYVDMFLNGDSKIELESIGRFYTELQNILLDHQSFFRQQESNPWALTNKLFQSLITSPASEQMGALERLLQTATISCDSLQLFSDSSFRQKILSKIIDNLKISGFLFRRVSPDGSLIYLDFKLDKKIHKLIIYYIEFVNSYGQLLFNNDFSPINGYEYIKNNKFKVDEQFYAESLSNIESVFPNDVYFYRENRSIIVVESRSFLIFSDNKGPTYYTEMEFGSLFDKLYKWYLVKEIKSIQQWIADRKNSLNKANKLEDLHDLINTYTRGVIDDKKSVRRR